MDDLLTQPIVCKRKEAWLGLGYYFWVDEEFAKYWGEDSKMDNTGAYDIYMAEIEEDGLLNAVFSEKGYYFYQSKIEETVSYFKENSLNIELSTVNRFLSEKVWKDIGITGIIFDDLPRNPSDNKRRIYSEIRDFYYKKRIQFVLFDINKCHSFVVFLENQTL